MTVPAVPVAVVSAVASVVVSAVGDRAGAALVEVEAGAAEVATTAGLAVSLMTGGGNVGACVAAAGAQAAKIKANVKTTPKKGILLISFSLQT